MTPTNIPSAEMPALPEPFQYISDGTANDDIPVYTADQFCAYALAAIAQDRAARAQAEPVEYQRRPNDVPNLEWSKTTREFFENEENHEWWEMRVLYAEPAARAHGEPEREALPEDERQELERLRALVNSPETRDFLVGVRNEVCHQVERWGTVNDRAKEPADWFWLVGYLGGKALTAHVKGDTDKALHHCISTAAALANWHAHILHGAGLMQPGSSDLQDFLRETFGTNVIEYQERT